MREKVLSRLWLIIFLKSLLKPFGYHKHLIIKTCDKQLVLNVFLKCFLKLF